MNIYISENIKRLRREKNLTQEALADVIGISFQAVSKWERGDAYPDITLLPVIANYFGITIDELFGNDKIKSEESIEKKEEGFLLFQQNIIKQFWDFQAMLPCYHDWYADLISPEDRLAILKIRIDLSEVIYGNDINHGLIYEDMARFYFSMNDKENGYLHLEKAVDTWINALEISDSEDIRTFKSPLFNRLTRNKPQREAGTNIHLNNLKTEKEYDYVRNEERFMQCVSRLEELIKCYSNEKYAEFSGFSCFGNLGKSKKR